MTRYTLIDPLLRELGWDTENPDLVIPEYKTDDGRPDYALLSDSKPVMMVEAKKLGTPLRDKVLTQGLNYANGQGTKYFSVSDGARWEIYETFKPVPTAEKRIVEFNLKSGSVAEACLKALTLWGLRVSGQVATSPEPRTPNAQRTPSSDKQKWQPLSKLDPQRGSRSPVEIQFPDGSAISIETWKSLLVEIVRWLEKNGLLTANHCPLRMTPKSKKYTVSTKPIHSDERTFLVPERAGSLYIEAYVGSKEGARTTRTVIERVGQDPAQFKVRSS